LEGAVLLGVYAGYTLFLIAPMVTANPF